MLCVELVLRVILEGWIRWDIRPEVSVTLGKSRLVDQGTILVLNSSVNRSVE